MEPYPQTASVFCDKMIKRATARWALRYTLCPQNWSWKINQILEKDFMETEEINTS